jgi:hypothetical protein
MVTAAERRAAYESAVRDLRKIADEQLADGVDKERVARLVVARRNELKVEFRRHDDPPIVAAMESRNLAKYVIGSDRMPTGCFVNMAVGVK